LPEQAGFEPKQSGDTFTVSVPRFRSDIEIKEDVAEEVARMYGYDKIPQTLMHASNFISEPNKDYEAKQAIKEILIGLGGFEVLTYAFTSPESMARLKFDGGDIRNDPVRIINPLGEEYSVMRTSAVAGMLETLTLNYNKKNQPELMFELANIYLKPEKDGELPVQKEIVSLGKFGSDYYEIKGVIQALMAALKIGPAVYTRSAESFLHPGCSADISISGEVVGFVGRIHPNLAKIYEICDETIVAQLDAEALVRIMQNVKITSKILTKYPAVERDLAFVVDSGLLASVINDEIIKTGGAYLTACEVFDVYVSDALGAGKKSLAFNLTFRSEERTLTDEEVDQSIRNIIDALENTGTAKLRQ
jgi:phenylalanyl-tRNA synthetase beta chain